MSNDVYHIEEIEVNSDCYLELLDDTTKVSVIAFVIFSLVFSVAFKMPPVLPPVLPIGKQTRSRELSSIMLTVVHSMTPNTAPTAVPSIRHSNLPTAVPTEIPSVKPTALLSLKPTIVPSAAPSIMPTVAPTMMPPAAPTIMPTVAPMAAHSAVLPSLSSVKLSLLQSTSPTKVRSKAPTVAPLTPKTILPTKFTSPTKVPSKAPTAAPSTVQSIVPTASLLVVNTTYLWRSDNLMSNLNRKTISWGSYTVVNSEMIITYPNNSCAANLINKGGVGFYAYPIGQSGALVFPTNEIIFQYDVYFDPKFDWVKGGKLPGLYGGATGADGGNHIDNGMSARLMWRRNGGGELYMYIPLAQDSSVTAIAIDEYPTGLSLGRNQFYFVKGQWQTIKIRMKMNDVGVNNGILELSYDNVVKISLTKINLRSMDYPINGIMFQTFFGGGDMTWKSSSNTYIKIRNMYLKTNIYQNPVETKNVGSSVKVCILFRVIIFVNLFLMCRM